VIKRFVASLLTLAFSSVPLRSVLLRPSHIGVTKVLVLIIEVAIIIVVVVSHGWSFVGMYIGISQCIWVLFLRLEDFADSPSPVMRFVIFQDLQS
jgi:hypothetical protein